MQLRFNTGRTLTRLAADAAHIEAVAGVRDRPWCRTADDDPTAPGPAAPARATGDANRRRAVEAAIEAVVLGDPERLGTVLTHDAVGWSPALAFSSRADALRQIAEQDGGLEVLAFEVTRLVCTDRVAVGEWEATATVAAPVLVGDDVLVDARGREVLLSGASIVDLRGEQVSSVHTYFDDASLIEQVVLGRPERHH